MISAKISNFFRRCLSSFLFYSSRRYDPSGHRPDACCENRNTPEKKKRKPPKVPTPKRTMAETACTINNLFDKIRIGLTQGKK